MDAQNRTTDLRSAEVQIRPASPRGFLAAAFVIVAFPLHTAAQPSKPAQKLHFPVVDVRAVLTDLLEDEDTDGDKKITVEDGRIRNTARGDRQFWFKSLGGSTYEVTGTYYLSNLLQELTLAAQSGKDSADLDFRQIFESPTHRISRLIREVYWDGLTRRIDTAGLSKILSDDKTSTIDGRKYLYVPHSDSVAFRYYSDLAGKDPELRMTVVRLPEALTSAYVRSLDGHHGLLSLKLEQRNDRTYVSIPYVVPGGRFNELYGWDSYFICLGLINDGKIGLARGMVDNLVYEIDHYGKILNANRTYYLTRSQPPFLTSMVLSVYHTLPKTKANRQWLAGALSAAIKEYFNVWMNSDHLTSCGLSRYFDSGSGPAPEVEPGQYDDVYAEFASKHGMEARAFEEAYLAGAIKDEELDRYFVNDRAMRESGHDTSYRLVGRCADLVTVDLNSLLFKIESDIAATINREFSGSLRTSDGKIETGAQWEERAGRRKKMINQLLWNEAQGIYSDYDVVRRQQTGYVSATTFYPMWTGAASRHQAELLIRNALPLIEAAGGIAASSEESRGPLSASRKARQWDYPNGWAPHQILVWAGLTRYGYDSISRRLAYRWLFAMTVNAVEHNGTITEKLDVVKRSHEVFAEYGNVGSNFAYITREGFGWSDASYQIGLQLLSPGLRRDLDLLVPPEWIQVR